MSEPEIGIIRAARRRLQAARAARDEAAAALCGDDLDVLQKCVEVCRTYRLEAVVVTNIKTLLQDRFETSPDIKLFGMALMHHVAAPDDLDLLECTEWVYWHLLRRKAASPAPAPAG